MKFPILNSSAPRILFLNHAAVLGGGELSLLDIASAYAKTSQVLLLSDGLFRKRLVQAGVNVEILETTETILSVRTSSKLESLKVIPGLLGTARKIAKKARGFDLIYANSQKAFIVSSLARLMGSPKVVWHLRDILTARHFSPLNRHIAVTFANRWASRVLVNSQATEEAFISSGGKAEILKNVSHGISYQSFDEVVPIISTRRIRKELGIGDVPLIGSFSRLSYWKGQHILLEALKQLPGVHALIVGEALFGEVEYLYQLRTLAETRELVGRVHWLGFRPDVPDLMKACDVIVHASTEPEPFGRVIVEGQLAKKPVVATVNGGASEIITDGLTGRLVPANNPIILANTLIELLSNPTATAALALRGYDHARANFSLEKHLKTVDHVLAGILGRAENL